MFSHEIGNIICYGHWVLLIVLSHTRQGMLFVAGIWFCILSYLLWDERHILLRALGSASCVITYETGDTICYRHWVLHLVLSRKKTGYKICYGHWVQHLVTSHIRAREYDSLQALGSAFVLSHPRQKIGFLMGIGFYILCYHARDRGNDLLRALGSASCVLTYVIRGSICITYNLFSNLIS